MKNLEQIKILPAREQVASILRKAILTGEIKEGREITLEEISNQVGVSSMPVREAFQILDADGLIKLRHNKGAIVLGVNKKNICDHYKVRALLESECASLSSRKNTDISNIVSIYEMSKKEIENGNFTDYSEYNQAFHVAIWEASDNEKMKSMLSSMWNGLSIGYKVTEEEYAKKSFNEHTQILNAIKNNDGSLARELMSEHIFRSMDDILTNLICEN